MKKSIIFLAVMLLLCSCAKTEREQLTMSLTEESSQTEETISAETTAADTEKQLFGDHTTAETTVPTEEMTEEMFVETEYVPDKLYINQDNYDYGYVEIYFTDDESVITDEEIAEITAAAEKHDDFYCSIRNAHKGSLDFLFKCPQFDRIFIETEEYSDKDINSILEHFPESKFEYHYYTVRPWEQFPNGYPDGFSLGIYSPEVKDNSLGVWFCNNSDETVTAESVKVSYYYNDEWVKIPFLDGSYEKTLDVSAEPRYNLFYSDIYPLYEQPHDFELTEDNFDFTAAKTGRYKLTVTTDKGDAEIDFYIKNSDELAFLTEEQREILLGADDIIRQYFSWSTSHPDEFIVGEDGETVLREKFCDYLTYDLAYELSYDVYIDDNGLIVNRGGDRGSSIMYDGNFIQPVYVGEDKIIMKRVVVNSHGDSFNDFSLEVYNIEMLPTEDGWRVNKMYEYY